MLIQNSDTKIQLVIHEIKKLISKNKTCSKHEFARFLVKKYPLQFLSEELARNLIRRVTGAYGKRHKKVIDFPSN